MTTKEMIKVMEHYDNGGEVESRYKHDPEEDEDWTSASTPVWDWFNFDYRIKPEPRKTKTVWFWRVKLGDGPWFMDKDMFTEEDMKKEWPEGTEYKRLDVLGSEEVEV